MRPSASIAAEGGAKRCEKTPVVYRKGYIILRIAGYSQKEWPFEMLEPCAVKVACTVLRGLGAGNSPRLPDSSVSSYLS